MNNRAPPAGMELGGPDPNRIQDLMMLPLC